MNLLPVAAVARKELVEALRDRRAIATLVFTAVLGPALISLMLNQRAVQKKSAEEVRIAIAGPARAGDLSDWLGRQPGVSLDLLGVDAEAAARRHQSDVTLELDQDFARDLAHSRPAHVRLFSDSTRSAAQPKVQRVVGLLNRYGSELAVQRLIVRGVSPSVAAPIALDQFDIASAQERGAVLLNVVLSFVIMGMITAGMQIATDSTAGERERSSLEALLLNGVPPWQVAAGKWLAATVAALAGMVVAIAVMYLAISRLSLDQLGLRFHLDPRDALAIFAVMCPLAFLLTAIETWLSCYAKSYKEAQSFTMVLIIPTVAVGGAFALYSLGDSAGVGWLPLLGQYAAASRILAGQAVPWAGVVVSGMVDLLLAAVLVYSIARMLASERMIVGR